jgi:hypothetical protein
MPPPEKDRVPRFFFADFVYGFFLIDDNDNDDDDNDDDDQSTKNNLKKQRCSL